RCGMDVHIFFDWASKDCADAGAAASKQFTKQTSAGVTKRNCKHMLTLRGRCNGRSQLLRGSRVNGTGSVPFKEPGSAAKNSRRAIKKDRRVSTRTTTWRTVHRLGTHLSPEAKSETCSKDQIWILR